MQDIPFIYKSLYEALVVCEEIIQYENKIIYEKRKITYMVLKDPLEKISLYLSRVPELKRHLSDVIDEVNGFLELCEVKLFDTVTPEDLELVVSKAKSWANKIRNTIEIIEKETSRKPPVVIYPTHTPRYTPEQVVTIKPSPELAYLLCIETGEKVQVPSYCIIGRDPYTNHIAFYSQNGVKIGEISRRDLYVSRYFPEIGKPGHATIYFDSRKKTWIIEDLNSTNGTRINNKLIPPRTPVQLKNGDTIEIGATSLKFTYTF